MEKSKLKRPLNPKMRAKITAKKCAWKKYVKFKNQSDYCKHKKLRDEVRIKTRLLDKVEQNNIALLSKNNPQMFWSYINSKVKSYNQIDDLTNTKNDPTCEILATTNEDRVDILNDFFSSVFIDESYGEVVEEAISGIPNMDKLVIAED
jgi:hypothetical protein